MKKKIAVEGIKIEDTEIIRTDFFEDSVYRMLSKNANPSFHSVVSFVHNLGMDFRLSTMLK